MNLLEKEILFMVSRLRCLTESQFNKIYNYKRESKRNPHNGGWNESAQLL